MKFLSMKAAVWLLGAIMGLLALQYAYQQGYERRDSIARAEQTALLAHQQREIASNVADASRRNNELQQRLQVQNQLAGARALDITKHLTQQEQTHLETLHEQSMVTDHWEGKDRPLLGAAVLDEHTVRLLNDARANRDWQAGSASDRDDEEGRAAAVAPAVTGTAFAVNDLEVVRLYHELAARHDGLVEWVIRQCVAENSLQAN